jgi:hypothetical protein
MEAVESDASGVRKPRRGLGFGRALVTIGIRHSDGIPKRVITLATHSP